MTASTSSFAARKNYIVIRWQILALAAVRVNTKPVCKNFHLKYVGARARLCVMGDAAGVEMLDDYYRQYGLIAIFIALAVAVPTGMLVMSWAVSLFGIRPRKPNPIKRSLYECGFETISGTWNQFNFRFYAFALIFVVFDVEVVFLFPWAASFGLLSRQFGTFALVEMAVFIAILLVGWLYAWRKGALEWS